MAHRLRSVTTAALVAAVSASALFASIPSANADEIGYVPPKRDPKTGKATTPITGPGDVMVKVYVTAAGKPKNVAVARSTNHGDDAAAKEVAMSSRYAPALRGGKPVAAYVTYTLRLKGDGTTADPSAAGAIHALNLQAKYAEAKKLGLDYVQGHPSDTDAVIQTAIAASFDKDDATAAELFDKAGSIPDRYKGPAIQSYLAEASAKLSAKDYTAAAAYAKKGAELAPGAGPYNILGNAELSAGDATSAAADFEKAKSYLATDKNVTPVAVGAVNSNLAQAYLQLGDLAKAQAAADAAKAADPTRDLSGSFAKYYQDKGYAAAQAGKTDEAVAAYEAAAKAAPKYAASLYTSAANTYGKAAKPDYKNMKAEADKALAIDPNDLGANFTAGVALLNDGKSKDALPYLTKAQTAAAAGTDTALQQRIADAIKAAGGSTKK